MDAIAEVVFDRAVLNAQLILMVVYDFYAVVLIHLDEGVSYITNRLLRCHREILLDFVLQREYCFWERLSILEAILTQR